MREVSELRRPQYAPKLRDRVLALLDRGESSPWLSSHLAYAFEHLGRRREALVLYERSLAPLMHHCDWIPHDMARCLMESKRSNEALLWLEYSVPYAKSRTAGGTLFWSYFTMEKVLRRLGRTAEADETERLAEATRVKYGLAPMDLRDGTAVSIEILNVLSGKR